MKYVAIRAPRSAWDDDPIVADVSTRTVIIEDDNPTDTGLVDHSGTPIYRLRDRLPFGFVRD